MLAILILGCSGLLGGFLFHAAAGTAASRPPDPGITLQPADSQTAAPLDARAPGPSASSGTVCTLKVVRADPTIDPGIVMTLKRQVDAEMVIASPCARATEAAGQR